LWLGPNEWLVVDPPDGEAALEAALAEALAGGLGAAVDLSANRTTIELRGPHARSLLARGCSLDLHPRAFAPGQCAQTMVGRAGVILEQRDALPTYRLFVRGSFAGYLATWLLDALAEIEASSAALRQRSVRATSLNV
jgi:sarcosine oxidase subunit gamma